MPRKRVTRDDIEQEAEDYAASVEHVGGAAVPSSASRAVTVRTRDGRGRFARHGARERRVVRRAGRRGPSYLWYKRKRTLARTCVVAEHRIGRLEAEIEGQEWSDPVKMERVNMGGIRKQQSANVRERLKALEEVMVDLHEAADLLDVPKRHERLTELLNAKLVSRAKAMGRAAPKPMTWGTIYRKPYAEHWLEAARIIDTHLADAAATISDRLRFDKRVLIHRILFLQDREKVMREQIREMLLAQSLEEDGWTPIPRR